MRRTFGEKAHVQHAVGLIDDEDFDMGEPGVRAAQVIEKPARRRDEEFHRGAEGMLLKRHTHAAEDGRGADGRVRGQIEKMLVDLRGEFAGGRQDEGAGPRSAGGAGVRQKTVEGRQEESGRLARAGGGGGKEVVSQHRGRDGLFLDRGGPGESQVLDRAKWRGGNRKTRKASRLQWEGLPCNAGKDQRDSSAGQLNGTEGISTAGSKKQS